MELTVLAENTAPSGQLIAEHGLSLYLRCCGKNILFDAGQTDAFIKNAELLGIDLQSVDFAVLTHGHYDHSGGFLPFFRRNQPACVYASPWASQPHYNAAGKDIGIDPALTSSGRLVFAADGDSPAPGLTLVCLPLPPADHGGMTVLEDGVKTPEDFRHEQYLLMEEDGKRILITGCAHKGIAAIAEFFQPDILIGGFHLKDTADPGLLTDTALRLQKVGCRCYTCHCTGREAYDHLKTILGGSLHRLSTGDSLRL